MLEVPEAVFTPGRVVNEVFQSYRRIDKGAVNYLILSSFRLGSGPFYGRHSGIQLNNMQIGHAYRGEAIINDGVTPQGCLSVGIVKQCSALVTVNFKKLKAGDLIVIDDSAPYHLTAGSAAELVIISIRNSCLQEHLPELFEQKDTVFNDPDRLLIATVDRIWNDVDGNERGPDQKEVDTLERELLHVLKRSHALWQKTESGLSEAEKKAFSVKAYIVANLQETMTIASLVQRFDLSDKTLETTFKNLFGLTPKQMINSLKLNRVHEELSKADPKTSTVSEIAIRWGFSHFGRFAGLYRRMFGELPSVTLRSGDHVAKW